MADPAAAYTRKGPKSKSRENGKYIMALIKGSFYSAE